jgi:hypothetical protein
MGQLSGEAGTSNRAIYNKFNLSYFLNALILLFPALLFGYFSGAWGFFLLLWATVPLVIFYREFIIRPKYVTISDSGVLFKYRTGIKVFSSWQDIIEVDVSAPKQGGHIFTSQKKRGFPLTREIAELIRTEYRLHMGQSPYSSIDNE